MYVKFHRQGILLREYDFLYTAFQQELCSEGHKNDTGESKNLKRC
jgi:hypothetical protein